MKCTQNVIRYSITLFLLGFMFSSCGLLPSNNATDAGGETNLSKADFTETPQIIPEKTATFTKVPTETLIPLPTSSPTDRPTWTPFPTKTLRPTWTASPTLSPTATKEVGWIIKDDFSDVTEAWFLGSGENWEMGYARGGYYMSVLEKNVEITSSQSWLKLADTRVILDVFKENGKGYWGISCRESSNASYYTIFITSEGTFGYGETRNGRVELTTLGKSQDIFTSNREVNHIMAECRGSNLTLFVNDIFMFRKEIVGLSSGWVGMMVGTTYEQDKVTVNFDNIEIWGPIESTGD